MTTASPSPLEARTRHVLQSVPTLARYPAVAGHLSLWLADQRYLFIALELCLGELGVSASTPGIAETVAAWMLLNSLAGPLDNYVDQDKDMGVWSDNPEVGLFIATALIGEALALPLTCSGRTPQAAGALAAMLRDASLGQIMDVEGVAGLEEYERMITLKTGGLNRGLFEATALAAQAPPAMQISLSQFGQQTGLATQILNDMLGVWKVGAANDISDLQKPQHTLPILYGLHKRYDPALKQRFRQLLSAPPGQRDVPALLAILEALPTKTFIKCSLLACRAEAKQALAGLSVQAALMAWFDEVYLGQAETSPPPV